MSSSHSQLRQGLRTFAGRALRFVRSAVALWDASARSDAPPLLAASVNALYVYDVEEERCVYVSPRLLRLTGYSLDDLDAAERSGQRALWPEARPAIAEHLQALSDTPPGVEYELEHPLRTKEGRWIRCQGRASVLSRSRDGRARRIVCIVQELREPERAERRETELAEREALLRAITEAVPDPVFAKHRDGRMLLANSATLRAIGRPAEAVLGRSENEWHHDATEAAAIQANDRRIMATGEVEIVEELLTTPTGLRIFSGSKAPLRNAAGAVIGLVGVSRDVTEQRAAEQALRDREERLRLALRGGGMGMWEFDLARRRVFWDDRQKELWGFEPAESDGNTEAIFARVHPDDRAALEKDYASVMLGEPRLFESEFRIIRPDGSLRWLASFGTLAVSSAGRRIIGVNYDITARKQAEAALQARERELQELADNSPDILTRFDRELRHVFISAAIERATGRRREEFVGKTARELGMPSELCERWDAVLRAAFAEGRAQTLEFRFTGPSGTRLYESRVIPEFGPDGEIQYVLGITRDRTAEHAAAVALREAQERFQLALQRAPVILFNQDRDLRYTWLHKPLAPWSEDDSLGKTDADLIPAEDARRLEELKREVIRTGRGIRAEVALRPAGKPEYFDLTIEPLRDDRGAVKGIACAALEITGLKQAEAELRAADRQKDEFLATLAHELRNPLAPLRSGLHVLKLSPDGPGAVRAREIMERQLTHMVRLIDDLLDVARISQGKVQLQRKRIELRTVIEGAVEAAQPSIKAHQHELTVDVPEAAVWLDADPIRLVQVVANLLTNAAKYTPNGGHIHLGCSLEDQHLILSVTDDGMGLPTDMLDRVFEMFAQVNRSLHRSQGGLGIGLALVRRLVEMHGGEVFARSPGLGRGSTFTVRLPVDSAPLTAAALARKEPHEARHSQRILIVDDNVDAADSIADLLRLMGYEPRTAYDGPQALEAAAAFKPQLVFLDIGLPGMSGYEVAARLRGDPALRGAVLVALTGWGSSEDRRRAEQAGFDFHLTKPVDAAALVEVLERLAQRDAPHSGGRNPAC